LANPYSPPAWLTGRNSVNGFALLQEILSPFSTAIQHVDEIYRPAECWKEDAWPKQGKLSGKMLRLSTQIQRSGPINRTEHLHIWIILSLMLRIYNRRQYASIGRTKYFWQRDILRDFFCGYGPEEEKGNP
jgi:hypothetical protein